MGPGGGPPPAPAGAPRPAPAPAGPVRALVGQADERLRAGDPEGAAWLLERALRLFPADAELWHRLAAVRLAQGRWDAARHLADRSNALAAGRPDLQGRNWAVIAEACRGLGDAPCEQIARGRAHDAPPPGSTHRNGNR